MLRIKLKSVKKNDFQTLKILKNFEKARENPQKCEGS